jgi:alpha-tubulin suppressor-like RCC1 family protein
MDGGDGVDGGTMSAAAAGAVGLGLGGWRSCAVLADRTVRCWGQNPGGLSLPGEPRDESATPTPIAGLRDVEQLAVGWDHTCARVKGGTVWCWGANDRGQLGDGTTRGRVTPAAIGGLDRVVQIVAGNTIQGGGGFSCAVREDGGVRCWGSGDTGVLSAASPTPTPIAGVDRVVDLAAGEGHVCAARSDGRVVCWGRDDRGQCGAPPAAPVGPTVVAGVEGAVDVEAGPVHTCARLRDGTVTCWGDNAGVQLGDGPEQAVKPIPLAGARGVAQLALGRAHTCVRSGDGRVQCVGGNDRGPFGFPQECAEPRGRLIPGPSGVHLSSCASLTEVRGLGSVLELAHGSDHACARLAGGAVRCWGGEAHSELGNRALGNAGSKQPVAVDLDAPAPAPIVEAQVLQAEAAGNTTCALMSDHGVRCWGEGALGQLGVPMGSVFAAGRVSSRAHPEPVPGVAGARVIALGGYTGCAVLDDGRVSCWGNNRSGELGDRRSTESRAAAIVPGLDHVRALTISPSSSEVQVCALLEDATARCWGGDGSGQLGVDHPSADGAPVAVPGLTGVVQIAAGYGATCAVRSDGSVWCFGDDARGQLGDGAKTGRAKPAPVPDLRGVAQVALAYDHACARLRDGSVSCWGPTTPKPVAGLTEVDDLRAGYSGIMVRHKDGTVATLYFDSGATPQPVAGLADVVQMSWSGYHACAVRGDRTLRCWGANGSGQMGDTERGYGGEQKTPSPVRW